MLKREPQSDRFRSPHEHTSSQPNQDTQSSDSENPAAPYNNPLVSGSANGSPGNSQRRSFNSHSQIEAALHLQRTRGNSYTRRLIHELQRKRDPHSPQRLNPGMVDGRPISLQREGQADTSNLPADAPTVAPPNQTNEPSIDEFEFDKTDIPAQHMVYLADLKARLLQTPNAKVTLTGHTDTVGQEQYNQGLGKRRAEAIRNFLTADKGVNPEQIIVDSRGETQPAAGQPPAKLDPNVGEKNPKNRRVEISATGLATPGWTFDPIDPGKKNPIDLNLPPDKSGTGSTPTPPPDGQTDKTPIQGQLSYTVVRTRHVGVGGADSSTDTQHQFTATLTWQRHQENKSGLELTPVVVTVDFNQDFTKITNIQGAVQAAWVWPTLNGLLQAGTFAQLSIGGANTPVQDKITGKSHMTITPTLQAAIGGQAMLQLFGGHVQAGAQVTAGPTTTWQPGGGSQTTLDFGAALVGAVQVTF